MVATKSIKYNRPYTFTGREDDPYFQTLEGQAAALTSYRRFLEVVRPVNVLDVGANIGLTVAMAHDLGAETVVAFEPSPRNYAALVANCSANNIPAQLHNCAAGIQQATASFCDTVFGAGAHMVGAKTLREDTQPIEVPVAPLDSFIGAMPKIDAVKIDVEGHELGALAGARELLAKWRPSVFIELNAWALIAFADQNPRGLIEAVRELFPYVVNPLRNGRFANIGDDEDMRLFLHRNITQNGGVDDLIGTFDVAVRDELLAAEHCAPVVPRRSWRSAPLRALRQLGAAPK